MCELANVERSNLYLKLFKLVFGSVSLLANENEQMLKVTFVVTLIFVPLIKAIMAWYN